MVISPTLLRITAHSTPHQSDPPDAHEFYAALGMLAVAWGRLEGHVIGNLLTIMNFPEMAPLCPLPLTWERRRELWTRAFTKVPALQPCKGRAVAFMNSLIAEKRTETLPRTRSGTNLSLAPTNRPSQLERSNQEGAYPE